jgi:hypothetical protein
VKCKHGDKGGSIIKFKPKAKVKMVTPSVNIMDVRVITLSKTSEEHVFKD